MKNLKQYILTNGNHPLTVAQCDGWLGSYRWFSTLDIVRAHLEGKAALLPLMPHRGEPSIAIEAVDGNAILEVPSDLIIDKFLQQTDLKIVAQPGDIDKEIIIEPKIEESEDIVSEELAQIYAAQGLNSQAIDIYTKLSLLNSEKSVYFAELIATLKSK